jgi:intein/homing endonuclease
MSNQNTNLTVWQRLAQAFGPNSLLNQDYPVYKFDKKELLKTTNKQEYELAKLQAQQSLYLSTQWAKVENNLYTQGVYFEPTRLASYYDYESMEYSIAGDTKIATPDGFITIEELAKKGRDHEFITYAYDHNLGKVVPALARNAHYTRDEMTYKITFDDGSHIIATYGHRFLKRDGVFCEVENLKPGDSMMPFYRKSFYDNQNYNWVYVCNKNEGHHGWVSEHKLIAEWYYDTKVGEDEEVYHIDFNGKNNLPENLKIWNISEHRAYHARLNNEKLWANPEYRRKMLETSKRTNKHQWNGVRSGRNNPAYIQLSFNMLVETAKSERTLEKTAKALNVSIKKIQNELKFNGFKNWDTFLDVYKISKYVPISENYKSINFDVIPWDLLVEVAKKERLIKNVCKKLNITHGKLRSTLRQGGYNNWTVFTQAYGIEMGKTGRKKVEAVEEESVVNHKIVSIEPYGVVPVYDLTVPGYKNFATDTIFSHNTPEISTALDIYAEESTTADQDGDILKIYSESPRIKSILSDLFNNTLDINTNLTMWTRNTCKYGDNFVSLKLDPDKGIVGCMQLPNIEIERVEKGMNGQSQLTNVEGQQKKLMFAWKNKDMEFNTWEIAHFRLLGDDRKLPYGTSMLDKARRIWKQLLLSEDAMLIYRTSRAPERRIFKIFVGNMDDADVEPYVQRVANKFKRSQVVDNKTGNVDLRFNQMAVDQDYFVPVRDTAAPSPIDTLPGACISLDTKIPLLDGRVLTLSEIINEWDNGNRNLWVYSCDPKTGSPEPGMITWAGITRKNAEVMKITLDNGEEIITTPDHKFVHRTNGFVEAQNLNVGDSLMPFYRQEEKIKSNTNTYQQIWDNEKGKWIFTHRMVKNKLAEFGLIKEWNFNPNKQVGNKNVIHHKNHNRYNNNPDNLLLMDGGDHIEYHQSVIKETIWANPTENKKKISDGVKRYLNNLSDDSFKERMERINNPIVKRKTTEKLLAWNQNKDNLKIKGKKISEAFTDERKKWFSKESKKKWNNTEYSDKVFSKKQTITFGDEIYNKFVSVFETNLRADKTLDILNKNELFISLFRELNSGIRSSMTNLDTFTLNHVDKMIKERGFKNFSDWKKTKCGIRGYKNIRQWKYHVDKQSNFNHKIVSIEWLETKMDTGTITVDGNELYSKSHTFALESGIFVKNSNLSEIADIEYIQKKLLTALRVPKAFLGFEEAAGGGKNLSLQDIRFARTINRIQKSMLAELNKIAIIHLFLLGFEDELNNFTLLLNNPSAQADLLKIDVWKEKILLYKDAVTSIEGIAPTSVSYAKKHILGFSEEEIKLDIQQQRVERAVAAELANTPNIITKTGIFDNIDSLYGGKTTGSTENQVAPTETPIESGIEGPAETTPVEPVAITPESKTEKNFNILVEQKDNIDYLKGIKSLNILNTKINNLLDKNK